jgi:transposase
MNRENPTNITQGYSRDHRPDLKQCILDLIVSSDRDIPLFFRGESGNELDKAVFAQILVEYDKQIDFESIMMVADSPLYSESNLELSSNMKWISRVPLSIKKAKNFVKVLTSIELKPSEIKGYSYQEEVSYGGIEQRWL